MPRVKRIALIALVLAAGATLGADLPPEIANALADLKTYLDGADFIVEVVPKKAELSVTVYMGMDFNHNGSIDEGDLLKVKACIGKTDPPCMTQPLTFERGEFYVGNVRSNP